MKLYYTLEISIDEKKVEDTHSLVDILSNDAHFTTWTHEKKIENTSNEIHIEVIQKDDEGRFDPTAEFVNLINKNKRAIDELKSPTSEFVVRVNYEYDQQCNMEFWPNELRLLAENNIVLCISCWDSGQEFSE